MTDIPPPFVGGSDSPRRESAEEKAFQAPYAPAEGGAAEAGLAGPASSEESAEVGSEADLDELYEEDLLPDMATEGEEIAVEGPMYDLEWPEEPEQETRPELDEPSDLVPDDAGAGDVMSAEPSATDTEMPDYLLGADSDGDKVATKPAGEEGIADRKAVAEWALTLQSGPHRDSIRDLVAELNVYPPEIAVPRAFAAGYLAARKEKET